MSCTDILVNHRPLSDRKIRGTKMLATIRKAFSAASFFDSRSITIFAAGSFGRMDVGTNSDLDLFAVAEKADSDRSRLDDLEVLAKMIEINRDLKYPAFSNDGEYLKVYSIEEMRSTLGHRKDDSENLFTARMLMLLESVSICNEALYNEYIKTITEHYFRDSADHKPFKPLFLLNDILRYWRTLCLNYESIRNDTGRPWRKRNVNLKFSRKLTVFASILPIISIPVCSPDDFVKLTTKTPMERFAIGLDQLDLQGIDEDFRQFLDDYETFLKWKEDENVEEKMRDLKTKEESRRISERFSSFMYNAMANAKIPEEYRQFLVI